MDKYFKEDQNFQNMISVEPFNLFKHQLDAANDIAISISQGVQKKKHRKDHKTKGRIATAVRKQKPKKEKKDKEELDDTDDKKDGEKKGQKQKKKV